MRKKITYLFCIVAITMLGLLSCTKLFDMMFTPQYTLKVEKMGQGTITAVADGKLRIPERQLLSGIKLDTGTNIVITASINKNYPPPTALPSIASV